MNRGPAKHSRPAGPTFVEKVNAAFGTPQDWLIELATFADREGLAGAERRVGYSRSAVSSILAGKYRGDLGRVEQMVRGALMAETVGCPVLGEIGRNRCLEWQKKPFAATSSHRTTMYRACRSGCEHARRNSGDDHE